MPTVSVTYDDVSNVARQMLAAKGELERQLNDLRGKVQMLTESGFVTPQAAPKFRQQFDDWNRGTTGAIGALEGMSSFLNEVVRQHQDLDTQLGQRANG